ncbi:MAG: alpha/beta fold hydrolase [Spartobacteria bacterium]|nr:alpha/beta fold hydrolase [Spartobacteria bacterium]
MTKQIRKIIICLAVIMVAGFTVLNILAYNHAKCMLVYVPRGMRTSSPEKLGFLEKVKVLLTGVEIPKPEAAYSPTDFNLQFTPYTIPVGDTIQLDAWYVSPEDNNGLIIMFHGYSSEKSMLLREAVILHSLGYGCLLVDFRGSGRSSESYTTIGYVEAEDVLATFAFAKQKWPNTPIVLLGQSMGAAAILRAINVEGIQPDAIILEAVFDNMLVTMRNRFDTPLFTTATLEEVRGEESGIFSVFLGCLL